MGARKRTDIALLILAAGESRRMGQAKQLLPWGESTLLEHALEQAGDLHLSRKYLLLGARAQQIMSEVDYTGFIPLLNPEWEKGMGTGIAFALQKMINDMPELKAVMIMLADQPAVDSTMLVAMLERFDRTEKTLLACAYKQKAGVPAIISHTFFDQLTALEGDTGARALFKNYPEQLERFELSASLEDIDDPDTYRLLFQKYFGQD